MGPLGGSTDQPPLFTKRLRQDEGEEQEAHARPTGDLWLPIMGFPEKQ